MDLTVLHVSNKGADQPVHLPVQRLCCSLESGIAEPGQAEIR